MRKTLVLGCLALVSSAAFAVRHIGFEADAFSRSCPVSSSANVVFSPASFEIDCALVAESLATIPKANVSEMMGVVLDFESAYGPIIEGLQVRTNGFSFAAARGFCLADIKTARVDHRHHLERAYGAEVLRYSPVQGAVSWFRAAMDGEMEDFDLDSGSYGSARYGFYDLVSCKVAWRDPFPVSLTQRRPFHLAKSTNVVELAFMSDVRLADTWETDGYTLLRLPLRGDAWFYAMLPSEGSDISAARADLTSVEIDRLLTVMNSVTEMRVAHGPCEIALPRLELRSNIEMSGILRYFRIPTKGLVLLAGDASAREYVQHIRFSLVERTWDEPTGGVSEVEEPGPRPVLSPTKRLVFDHPFVFFVYHVPTATIPVAGQFVGRE